MGYPAQPPKLAHWILSRLKYFHKNFSIIDDFNEEFVDISISRGHGWARLWYWWQTLHTLSFYAGGLLKWRMVMGINYLKIAIRNIKKHKAFSLITIGGFALGIASSMLILFYVNFHLSFDRYHENSDRIYRLAARGKISGKSYTNAMTQAALVPRLMDDYPEIQDTVRFIHTIFNMFRYQDNKFYESNFAYADTTVFSVFSYELVKGNPDTALRAPNTLVLTREKARKYFGNENPIGKTVIFNDKHALTVTGVMERPPANSHLQFDMLVSMDTLKNVNPFLLESRTFPRSYTYILLKPHADAGRLRQKVKDFFARHAGRELAAEGVVVNAILQPVTAIHLHSHLMNELPGNISSFYVYTAIIIAVLILVIAAINTVNLSLARSTVRNAEVGVRKVLGAFKEDIFRQFMAESIVYGALAFILGTAAILGAQPLLLNSAGQGSAHYTFGQPVVILEMSAILIFVCLMAGLYPAYILARFEPMRAIKKEFFPRRRISALRSLLVVSQIAISIGLIIFSLAIHRQMKYVESKNLGFNKDRVIYTKFHNDHSDDEGRIKWMNALKSELVKLKGVANASLASHVPGTRYYQFQYVPEGFSENQPMKMESYRIDDDFLDTMGMAVVQGRGFSRKFPGDEAGSILINETAARQIGWENPIGKKITRPDRSNKTYQVVGVINDFHSRSLHHAIEPLLFYRESGFHCLALRLRGGNITETLRRVKDTWQKFEPAHPFDYLFLDENIEKSYRNEMQMGRIIQSFTLLSVIIGCLGLFGLVSLMTEQRTKEIGIRKTIGATTLDIASLLVRELSKWVLAANFVAWPIAYIAAQTWLSDFAYKTTIGLDIFLTAGILSYLIILLTIGHRIGRAARSNPTTMLRYE